MPEPHQGLYNPLDAVLINSHCSQLGQVVALKTAVKALRKTFLQDVDYQVFLPIGETPTGGRPTEVFHLTVSCLEYLSVRANRGVFERYRACRLRWANSLP